MHLLICMLLYPYPREKNQGFEMDMMMICAYCLLSRHLCLVTSFSFDCSLELLNQDSSTHMENETKLFHNYQYKMSCAMTKLTK